ncbi:unnamed protein product [Ambrosiozyma monospora]|uniref:Unnamed protein product n=1 Tax=Ambrosiozyma monospora TaxID=43982 RepID=A0ACB5TBG6_AMBMO|nr:unnamed protein product [Ambrosiozyma monospora]
MYYFIKFTTLISPHLTNLLAGYELEPVSGTTESNDVTCTAVTTTVVTTTGATESFREALSAVNDDAIVAFRFSGAPSPCVEETRSDETQDGDSSDGTTEMSSNSEFDTEPSNASDTTTNSNDDSCVDVPPAPKILSDSTGEILTKKMDGNNGAGGSSTFRFGWEKVKEFGLVLLKHL